MKYSIRILLVLWLFVAICLAFIPFAWPLIAIMMFVILAIAYIGKLVVDKVIIWPALKREQCPDCSGPIKVSTLPTNTVCGRCGFRLQTMRQGK